MGALTSCLCWGLFIFRGNGRICGDGFKEVGRFTKLLLLDWKVCALEAKVYEFVPGD